MFYPIASTQLLAYNSEKLKAKHMSTNTQDTATLKEILRLHQGGKIQLKSKLSAFNANVLARVYTPGVAEVCQLIAKEPERVYDYTIKQNTVAIVTDGSAVLGLGNIGPHAALPVMEGKALLLKHFANIDAFPVCLQTQNPAEIINIVQNIAPSFGAINLEDIAAPHCFEIETALKDRLNVPVFHDDQHGTAIVTMAALKNALTLVKKDIAQIKVVINGAGAAGIACAELLHAFGATNIILCDRRGAIYPGRDHLNYAKTKLAQYTNPHKCHGTLSKMLQNADVFIGVSSGNLVTKADIISMNHDPIVFAMANPTPEIKPEIANGHVAVMATGRSDYPNQINNVLAFPGVFKGLLDARAKHINSNMFIAAANALASCVKPNALRADYIIPSVFDKTVVTKVADAVKSCL